MTFNLETLPLFIPFVLVLILIFITLHQYHQRRLQQLALEQLQQQLVEKNLLNEKVEQQLAILQPYELQSKLFAAKIDELETQVTSLNTVITTQQASYEGLQQKHQALMVELAENQVTLVKEQDAYHEKLQIFEQAKQQMSQEFQRLAQEVLETKQVQISQQSKTLIGGMIEPMQQVMQQFKDRIELVHKEDLEGRASLAEQLKQLQALNSRMSDDAKNLTQALKGDSKLQGNWGEMILEKLLESSGLRKGVEFEREKVLEEDGRRMRPDVILNLPGQKHIVIDAKVSLTAYELAINAASPQEVKKYAQEHLSSLSRHIKTLAEKSYQNLNLLTAPDFVLMFIPIEGAYLMAIESDPSIFEKAFEQKVAVITPTTLFTTLKTIEQLWRYERQSEYTQQLIKRAADVHDKFVGFIENFEKVGKQLSSAQTTYDTAKNQLFQGSGNLVRQAKMLKELAGKTKKEIPSELLAEADLLEE